MKINRAVDNSNKDQRTINAIVLLYRNIISEIEEAENESESLQKQVEASSKRVRFRSSLQSS